MSRALGLLGTLLRIGFAQAVAYRAELIVWILSYTMPLVMLALWSAVAAEGPVKGYDQAAFAAYFITTLVVRMVVAAWVVWELNEEIRHGRLGMRLLRPLHPLVDYASSNVAAIPIRFLLAGPIVVIALAVGGTDELSHDPLQWALVPVTLALAWVMTYLVQALIGTLAFFWESSLSIFDIYLGLYLVCSGYVMPLDLLPERLTAVIDVLPFRSMLAVPVEAILGRVTAGQTGAAIAVQLGWIAVFWLATVLLWRRGVARFTAFGG